MHRTPLAVFVNSKSGGGEGATVLARFRRLLDDRQIFELDGRQSPERGLKIFSTLPNARVLVCGGDGTVNWIFNYVSLN